LHVLKEKLAPEMMHALITTLRHTAVWYFTKIVFYILFTRLDLLTPLYYADYIS
jgi:hypothetical protein